MLILVKEQRISESGARRPFEISAIYGGHIERIVGNGKWSQFDLPEAASNFQPQVRQEKDRRKGLLQTAKQPDLTVKIDDR